MMALLGPNSIKGCAVMPTPFPTTWTERSAPPSTTLLEGPYYLQKQLSGHYIFVRGTVGSRIGPTKLASGHYIFSAPYPGSYFMGKGETNHLLIAAR
jgi:hypothetical protein